MIHITLTGTTCGEPCWTAREEICRCSCGGANHGCLLKDGAKQPTRSAKLDGEIHTLLAVGNYSDMDAEAYRLNTEAGCRYRYAHTARQHFGENPPVKMRKATAAQIGKWPELTAWREPTALITLGEAYILWKKEHA